MEDHTNSTQRVTSQVMTAMGFAMLALAFASIFITELERLEVPPLVIAFYRMAIATAILLPPALAFKWKEIVSLARKDLGLLVLGGICLAVHFGAWITSLKYVPIATSVVLVNSHPLFVVIASYTVFNWALKHVRPTAISLAFLGEPVVASVLALIFFAQRPPFATFVGGALVLAGVYLTTSRGQ